MSQTYTNDWSGFSEVREIEPFRTCSGALDSCGFRWTPSVEFLDDPTKVPIFEHNPLEIDDFVAEFRLEFDHLDIKEQSGRSSGELELHFVVRDKALNHFGKIASKPLDEAAGVFAVPDSVVGQLCGSRGLDFGMVVSPKRGIASADGLATNPGHVIAQKFFHLGSPPISASGFPVGFEHPEQFEDGINKDSVWYIRWLATDKISDPTATAEEVLRVVYNKNCSDKLYRIPENDPAGRLFWAEIAVEVFLEISCVVLSMPDLDAPPKGSNGFYPSLFRTVEKITGKPIREICREFQSSEPSAISRLRSDLHSFFNTVRSIERAKFGH